MGCREVASRCLIGLQRGKFTSLPGRGVAFLIFQPMIS